jgi:hypothetical protein
VCAPASLSAADYEAASDKKDQYYGADCDAYFGGKGEGPGRRGNVCRNGAILGGGDIYKRFLKETALY